MCAERCAPWWVSVTPIEWGGKGSPANRQRWLHPISMEDGPWALLMAQWKASQKGESRAGFWSVNRSLTNKTCMYMCFTIMGVLAMWWGDSMRWWEELRAGNQETRVLVLIWTLWLLDKSFSISSLQTVGWKCFEKEKYSINARRLFSPGIRAFTQEFMTTPVWNSHFPSCPSLIPKVIFFLLMKHLRVDSHATPHAHWGINFNI